MGIDSICSKLLKTVGLLAVRPDLANLRLKNRKENECFWLTSECHLSAIKSQCFGCHNANKSENGECHTLMISLFNFQYIGNEISISLGTYFSSAL